MEFFKATKVATNALYGDFTFKPYYDSGFQLDSITTFICHIARTLYNLAATLLRFTILALSLLNPFAWLGLPGQAIDLVDDVLALGISAVTTVIFPVIFVLRTLSTLMFGYEDSNDCGNRTDDEENMALAMKIR